MGYRMGEWTDKDLSTLPDVKGSFGFKISNYNDNGTQFVSTNLPEFYVGGIALPRCDPKHQLSNIVGSMKRVGFKPPDPDPELMDEFLHFIKDEMLPLYEPIQQHEWLTFEEWLEGTPYTLERKKELQEVYDEFIIDYQPRNHDHAGINSFIKDEPYGKFAAPRWINARADLFKCLFGPFVQTMMNRVIEDPAFIKKIPTRDRAAYILKMEEDDYVYVATDATSYEAHFRRLIMKIRHMFMFHLAGLPIELDKYNDTDFVYPKGGYTLNGITLPELLNVICGTQTMKMRNLGALITEMILASGEMDTSFGNTLTTKSTVCFAQKKHNVDWKKKHHTCEGDDSLAPFRKDCIPDENFYARLGFLVKVLVFDDIGKASFCGQLFDRDSMTVVTDPLEVLCKFGWTNRKYVHAGPSMLKGLLKSKLMSIACEYGNNPILWALAKRGMELVGHVNVRDSVLQNMELHEQEKYKLNVTKNPCDYIKPPTDSSRIFVEETFGVSINDQIAMEEIILKSKGCIDLSAFDFPPVYSDYYQRYSRPDTDQYFEHPSCDRLLKAAANKLWKLSEPGYDPLISNPLMRKSDLDVQLMVQALEKLVGPRANSEMNSN